MKLLFVCLGNICRSPAAEAVMRKLSQDSPDSILQEIDSAGTASYHAGERADSRMRAALAGRSYPEPSRSRQVTKDDFLHFDLILAMDYSNYRNLERLCPNPDLASKLKMFCAMAETSYEEVPDPYYGGEQGFQEVIDLVETVCEQILKAAHRDR